MTTFILATHYALAKSEYSVMPLPKPRGDLHRRLAVVVFLQDAQIPAWGAVERLSFPDQ